MNRQVFDSVPIWIRLPNLKLYYYTTEGLSKFGSFIGRPLYTDQLTASQSRLAFARICVEIKLTAERPTKIPFITEFGKLEYQTIEYEWVPTACDGCTKFGHPTLKCPWAPKVIAK